MKATSFLRKRSFWLGAAVVFTAKLGYLLWYGVLFEFDSIGYLTLQADLLHPPGYNAFCALLMKLTGRPESITFVQTLLFSLAASHAAFHWIRRPALRIAVWVLMGLDPCTGLLCADLMSEVLFLSLTLPLLVISSQLRDETGKLPWGKLLLAGLLLGSLMWLRHAALIVWVAVLAAFLLSRLRWQQRLLIPLVMMVVAQVMQLPIKIYYRTQFGTWQTSAYAGYSLWNTAAHLVPGSELEASPATDFERHAAGFPASAYSPYNGLSTAHIFSPQLPLQSFVAQQHLSTQEQMDLSEELKSTAVSLILQHPGQHLRQFMLPNLQRPFVNRETVDTRKLESEIPPAWHLHRTRNTIYLPEYWWPWAILLLLSSILLVARLRRWKGQSGLWLLTWVVAANWLAAHLVGAVFLRYMFFLTPFISLLLAQQVDTLLLKRDTLSPTLSE